ncbi:MAG: hypothetical protein ACON4Z_12665 [Planctomycetota bacterium]
MDAARGAGIVLVSPIPGKLHFWFLWSLFVMQVAKPLLARIGRRGGAAVLAATLVLLPLDYKSSSGLRLLAGGLLSVCFVTAVAGLRPGRLLRALAALGQGSMAIYLAHTIFSAALRAVLVKVGVVDETAHVLLGTAVGLGAPMVLYGITQRLGVSKYLGF